MTERMIPADLKALLPPPYLPTLADMADEERSACQWMQADVANHSVRYVIATPYDEDGDAELVSAEGRIEWMPPERVTPRPDLPRFEWPDTDQKVEDATPAKVGEMIKSADDPRISALPVGTILRDHDGEEIVKLDETTAPWGGTGYVPVAGDGTEFGPWTVAQLPKKPAPAPALPDGWRLADHPEYGRVVVTRATPGYEGDAHFVYPADARSLGYTWHCCDPAELTYLDNDREA